MSGTPTVYVTAIGMITSLGFDAASTAAAVRAGSNGYSESDYYNRDFQPMKVANIQDDALPPLHDDISQAAGMNARTRRMLRLSASALNGVLEGCSLGAPIPLLLAGPETLPGSPAAIPDNFVDYLTMQTGVAFYRPHCRLLSTGRAGGLQTLALAFRYFEETGKDIVLIGGVDSYRDVRLLTRLDQENRILAAGRQGGFAPGEAAGFLLLATEQGLKQRGHAPFARLHQPGLGNESGHLYSDNVCRGDGLSQAFAGALRQGDGTPVQTVYSSMNGEHLWAKEFGVAMTRHRQAFSEMFRHEHPADCLGDIGAAHGPIMIGLAAIGLRNGYIPGPALIYSASDTAPRAAACVQS